MARDADILLVAEPKSAQEQFFFKMTGDRIDLGAAAGLAAAKRATKGEAGPRASS